MNKNQKTAISISSLLGIAMLVWLGAAWYLSYQKVAITFPSSVQTLTVYHTASATSTTTVGKPVRTVTSGVIFKLRNGTYLLRPSGSKTDTTDVPLNIHGATVTKNLDIDYSSTYLQQLLTNQQSAINAAIYSSSTKLPMLYRANAGFLYHHGEWYGTTLSYIGTDTLARDTLRIVLHDTGSSWQVVTNPPQIILAATKYPGIPVKVLRAINAVDLGVPTINGQ